VRADTSDVAFRLLLALGEVWDSLSRAGIDPGARGLHVSSDFLGGYQRISAGPGSHSRLIVEWNESSRHLRILRCEEWPGFDATIAATVQLVRKEAQARGIAEAVDRAFMSACEEPAPARRTIAIAPGERGRLVGARRA
jgi:hypothetical protein